MLSDRDFFVIEPDEGFILNDIFDDAKDLYIEIGSGKGEFISQYPRLYLDSNFIGLEMSHKRINNCLKKLSPQLNPNVRLVRRFVDASIKDYFKKESISGAFIQHPDPWPKRRHHKRRLFQQSFLDSLAFILKKGAKVQVSTDHSEYAGWIAKEFSLNQHYKSLQDRPIQEEPNLQSHIETWFEQEQRRQGFEPFFMLYERI